MELEGKKSKEALLVVQKKHILMRCQNERDEARRLQRSGSSRGTRMEADLQDLLSLSLSFESCRSSAVDYIGELSPESLRKMQDDQEATSEASWKLEAIVLLRPSQEQRQSAAQGETVASLGRAGKWPPRARPSSTEGMPCAFSR